MEAFNKNFSNIFKYVLWGGIAVFIMYLLINILPILLVVAVISFGVMKIAKQIKKRKASSVETDYDVINKEDIIMEDNKRIIDVDYEDVK